MKNILCLFALLLLFSGCSSKKSTALEQEEAKYAKIDMTDGGAKLEFLKNDPAELDPEDILFVRVNPGTVTVGSLRATNEDEFYVMTKPFTKIQLSKLTGTEAGNELASSTPFKYIKLAEEKLAGENPDVVFSLPTAQQWDFAFLSGKINENEQPICWEWTRMNSDGAYTWRGRIWHIMELYEEAEEKKDTSIIQSDLGFRFAFKTGSKE